MDLECVCVGAMANAAGVPQNVIPVLLHLHVLHAMKVFVNNPYLGVFQLGCSEKARVNVVLLHPVAQLIKQAIDVLKLMSQGCACAERTLYVLLEARLDLV